MAIPASSAVLSAVPNLWIANSRAAAGEWSTSMAPTARYGEANAETRTALSSPAARPAATASGPEIAARTYLSRIAILWSSPRDDPRTTLSRHRVIRVPDPRG